MTIITKPNWAAPNHVKAFSSTRLGGHSQPPFDGNNLALHVGDQAEDVQRNRCALIQSYALPSNPFWLNQTHSNHCVVFEKNVSNQGDAAICRLSNQPLVVLTADCLPILLCDDTGTEVAVIHAGWRGLLNGIIENTLQSMNAPVNHLMVWIGPAICQDCFEVGSEVQAAYIEKYPFASQSFHRKNQSLYAHLPAISENIFKHLGVHRVYQSDHCTFELKNEYFSYRREKETGRIGTFIWFEDKSG